MRRISVAPPGFDARFGAIWRRYIYRMSDGSAPPDPLYRNQVAQVSAEVDLVRLNDQAATLLGLRDFGAFCRHREGASTIRTLLELVGRRIASGPMAGVIECSGARGRVLSLDGPLTPRSTGRCRHGPT